MNETQTAVFVILLLVVVGVLTACVGTSSRLEHCELTIRHLQSELETCKDESFEELVK